jgi:NAD(P)-dependent dehydrogenase (short-subunit alcohol dehydrogenase family)
MQSVSQLFSLEGQLAIVTGAASGLGRALAEGMAEAGADLVLADIDAGGLRETAELVAECGRRAQVVITDVTLERSVQALFVTAESNSAQVDILINNAGVADADPRLLHECSSDAWNRVLNVNLNGTFYCAREALKRMFPRKRGKIINIASMWGLAGTSSVFPLPAYAASKGAVVNLTREMALQYAPHGINVNAICPGFYRTRLGPFDDPAFLKAVTDFTPAGRIAEATEIKGAAIYLASSASNFVHGLMLTADGGCMAK